MDPKASPTPQRRGADVLRAPTGAGHGLVREFCTFEGMAPSLGQAQAAATLGLPRD